MKANIIVFLAFVAASQASVSSDRFQEWESFKAQYGKTYSEEEDLRRMKIYLDKTETIRKHNEEYEKGLHTYTLKINHCCDMLAEEVVQKMTGYKPNNIALKNAPLFNATLNADVPDSMDWREKGAVTDVKSQGECNVCWAFSATGALEGQHFIKTGQLVSLSEENLIDCINGPNKCQIGTPQKAFNYVKTNGGIDTEDSYPYSPEGEGSCSYDSSNIGATDTDSVSIPAGDENALLQAVASIGPISVGIDASGLKTQHVGSGVYNNQDCSSQQGSMNHAVLVVGYGTDESGQDYWLVKNSWGTSWGDEGYIKMARNQNLCGIANDASYPTV